MIKDKTVTAIILAAGNSIRFGTEKNKNFEIINQKSVISYSLEAFDRNACIDNIIVATREKDKEELKTIIEKGNYYNKITIVIGGNSRKESVYNCLCATNSDIVIIHDAARPGIKQEYINKCLASMEKVKGATIGVKSKDTIKIADDNNIIIETTKRNNTWVIQTPQCFIRKDLKLAHEIHGMEDITDDCMLMEKYHNVKIIEGDYTNIKLTTYEDLNILSSII